MCLLIFCIFCVFCLFIFIALLYVSSLGLSPVLRAARVKHQDPAPRGERPALRICIYIRAPLNLLSSNKIK